MACDAPAQTPERPSDPPPPAPGAHDAQAGRDEDPFDTAGRRQVFGGLRWGAYGELHYNNPQGGSDKLDFHRFVLMAKHDFNERVSLLAEVELEHAFVQDGEGELELEQAFLQFKIHDAFNIHAGILLVPISFMNLIHEPPLFHGVERPTVENRIIPTTWFESGAGIYGSLYKRGAHELNYTLNVHAGLDATGFRAKSGVRGGRQKGFQSDAEDFLAAGRLAYALIASGHKLDLAAAFAAGNSGQGKRNKFAQPIGSARTVLYTVEARYQRGGFELGASWAQGLLWDSETIQPDPADDPVGQRMDGFYVQAAFDVLTLLPRDTGHRLHVFTRYESFNTQAEVPAGFTANPAYEGTAITFGLSYVPVSGVVVKLDYQDFDNEADTGVDQWNLGIGFLF